MAKGSMTTNSTVDVIDKTLTVSGAPADAAAVGAALDEKANKDVIYDSNGNIIFYSKAVVDELLKKKLDLTGGTMSGKILINAIGSDVIKISGSTENADEEIKFERTDTGAALACGIGAGGDNMGLFDRTNGKWAFHVKSTTGDVYIGGTKCIGFVVASGDNYVRFGDGTQICFDGVTITGTNYLVTFPVPFTTLKSVTMAHNANIGVGVGLAVGYETGRSFRIYTDRSDNTAKGFCSYIAIGKWK